MQSVEKILFKLLLIFFFFICWMEWRWPTDEKSTVCDVDQDEGVGDLVAGPVYGVGLTCDQRQRWAGGQAGLHPHTGVGVQLHQMVRWHRVPDTKPPSHPHTGPSVAVHVSTHRLSSSDKCLKFPLRREDRASRRRQESRLSRGYFGPYQPPPWYYAIMQYYRVDKSSSRHIHWYC